jgi:hypothetical protein
MMLKKTMLAIGLASIAAAGTNASTLAVSGATKATGLTIGGKFVPGSDVIDFAETNNDLVFTVQGTANDAAAYANSLKHIDVVIGNGGISPASSIVADWAGVSMQNTPNATVTFPTANTIRLVTTLSGADAIVSGSTLTISGLKVLPETVASGSKVTGTVKAVSTIADGEIDSATASLATHVNEFYAAVVTKFNGVIDVAKNQKGYVSGLQDDAALSITNITANKFDVTSASPTFSFSGDFAFLDSDGDGKLEAKEGTIVGSGALSTLTTDFVTISGAGSAVGNGASTGIALVNATAETTALVIPVQTFTGAVDVSYTRGNPAATVKQSVASGLAIGAWTLNAASSTVDFLPFGNAFAHSISVINPNTADAEISVTLTGNGTAVTEKLSVTAKGKSVTEIGPQVAAIARAGGMTSASVKVVVDASNVTVKGLYYSKADGDRVLMTTSQ